MSVCTMTGLKVYYKCIIYYNSLNLWLSKRCKIQQWNFFMQHIIFSCNISYLHVAFSYFHSTFHIFMQRFHIFMQHFIFACSVFIFPFNISYFHATFSYFYSRLFFFHAATIFDIILHLVCKVNYIAVVPESLYVQSEHKTLMQYKNCLTNNENIFLL